MMEIKLLEKALLELQISLDPRKEQKLLDYMNFILEKNKVMNLTAITEKEDFIIRHFADSLSLLKYIKINGSLIDVGTGAGLPGMALKIALPEINLTLLDSLNKRINFLKEVSATLEISGINCIHARAEELAADALYREKYDYCTARAVSSLAVLAEYCLPFVKPGGTFIAYKGPEIENELKEAEAAIKKLGGRLKEVHKPPLPFSDITHTLIFIEKIEKTPKNFPRKPGLAVKNPIK